MRLLRLLLWMFLGASALATEVSEDQYCASEDNESVLQRGHEYTYKFHSEAIGESVGTTEDKGKMSIDCDVHISHIQDCIYNLQLQNCYMTASGGSPGSEIAWIDRQPLSGLTESPISFLLNKGEVIEVYTADDDPLYFVNIKKGALSAFVFKLSFSQRKVEEMHTDIHGTCPMTAEPVDGSSGSVRTSKDMLHCAYPKRPDWQFSPWSMFWNMSFIQYVINSTTDCDYKVDVGDHRIEKVFCKERHAIMLESTHQTTTAVQTNIQYFMEYVSSGPQKSVQIDHTLTRKTDIRFEYDETPIPKTNPKEFTSKAKKMMSDLILDSREEIRLFTIPQFTDFVAWLRGAQNLVPFVEIVKSCSFVSPCTDDMKELAMSYLKDALVQCNTIPCIKAVQHLTENDDLSSMYLNFMLYSWSNMHFSNPEFLTHFMNICSKKDTSFCWMTLGTAAQRYYTHYQINDREVAQELLEVATHFHDSIGDMCDAANPRNFDADYEKYLHYQTYFNAIGNMGEAYIHSIPGGIQQLTNCAVKSDFPNYMKISALQALKKINVCGSKLTCAQVHHELLPLLMNNSQDTTVRSAAYELLMSSPQFEEDLMKILMNDGDRQLKSYIASHLDNVLRDVSFEKNNPRFVTSMKRALDENDVYLEKLFARQPGAHSKSTLAKWFSKLSFMPKELEGFGYQFQTSKISQLPNVVPQQFHADFILKLFNKVMHVFEVGGYAEGVEDVILIFQKYWQEVDPSPLSFSKLGEVFKQVLMMIHQEPIVPFEEFHLDERLVENLKKILETYQRHSPKLKPYFSSYLELFNSTLAFLTSGDMNYVYSKMNELQMLLHAFQNGFVFNTTRVVRVIEAYHQVPTMMGLPLNWTTNATLAFSMRSGINLDYTSKFGEIHADGFLHPSAALTFLNRMVLDFPTITQIGVQANSSAYTSTQWGAEFQHTSEGSLLKIKKPQRSQKILELFRTNQMIKHDDYTDIPDWDIDRTSSSWCTSDQTSSLLGFEVCLSKSYPRVTHRMKPWALMAGWCKWQLLVNPYDESLATYNIEMKKIQDENIQGTLIKFSTPDSILSREVMVNITENDVEKETRYEMIVPAFPDFAVSYSKVRLSENGHRTTALVKFSEAVQYQILLSDEDRTEKRTEDSTSRNKSPKDKKISVLVQERIFTLRSQSNSYKWTRRFFTIGEQVKADYLFTFENLYGKRAWLYGILPPYFWEEDSKASFHLQLNWEAPIMNRESVIRQTKCYISTPKMAMELLARSLKMDGREQINVNFTRHDRNNLKAFANFTYDYWSSKSVGCNFKEIQLFNLTISRKSWALELQRVQEDANTLYDVVLTRAAMHPKQDVSSNYVGWWTRDNINEFTLQQHQVKLKANIYSDLVKNIDIVNRYSSISEQDLKDLQSKLVTADVMLQYPLFGHNEFVAFDGYFVLSAGPPAFRFQKNFVLESSYNNLRMTSHSVYRIESDATSLSHSSFFTHMKSNKKAYNIIHFKSTQGPRKCLEFDFEHNIKSSAFNLVTNATYKCHSEVDNLHTLLLDMRTSSSYWNMLNLHIDQIVKDVTPEYSYEVCNMSHPLMTINVTAEWQGKDLKKKAIFKSLSEDILSMELNIENLHSQKKTVLLSIDDDKKTQITYIRKMTDAVEDLHIKLMHKDAESNEMDVVNLNAPVVSEHHRVWKIDVNMVAFQKLKAFLGVAWDKISEMTATIAKDSEHPLNIMLKPTLNVTLYDYWKSLWSQAHKMKIASLSAVKEMLHSIQPFYEPIQTLFTNSILKILDVSRVLYNAIKDKSVTVWVIDYFQLSHYLQKGLANLPASLSKLPSVVLPDDNILRIKIYSWRSLYEAWDLEYVKSYFPFFFKEEAEDLKPRRKLQSGSKLAMIFGPQHVYTFDGYVYDVPKYPSPDCAFLLAHDVHRGMFTVYTTKESIHVLFPEMSVTINAENEVFINGSRVPSGLPLQSSNGKVTIKGGHIVELWSPSLSILCDGKNLLCMLELSPWHSGGTVGLLGNADDVILNEYQLPDSRLTSDLSEFLFNYEISGKQVCRNLQVSSTVPPSNSEIDQCTKSLSKACSLKDTQKPFLEACLTDVREDNSPCYATAALSALCFYQNKNRLSDCRDVVASRGERIHHKLEVVLIVNENNAMSQGSSKNVPYKGIESLLEALDNQFTENGYSSILYSLIGYGGEGVYSRPSVHTHGKNIWMPLHTMMHNIKKLGFKGTVKADDLEALMYAMENLGYDSYDSKVLIIITDKDKQTQDRVTLERIRHRLDKNGITLYTLTSYPSIEKGKKVFGVRADGLMFPSPKKGGEAYLDYPKGDLAKLTSGTRGALFLNKFMLDNKPQNFFTEFAQEVWAKVRREVDQCRACTLVRSGWWYTVNECSIVQC